MTRQPPKDPLVAIIGATGTGKSQLAVEIAKRYNGEIINGDAMQLYTGLPIITNKITTEEQQGVPHHLLGCIGLNEQTWVVGTFVKKATAVIDEIRSRGKLPILVGGTHYYTLSLLLRDGTFNLRRADEQFVEDPREVWPILQEPTPVILEELRRVDPIMADRWHPNDHRKIQRSLEIYLQTGRKASDIYAEQRFSGQKRFPEAESGEDPASQHQVALRFPTLIFWVHAEAETLRSRLDDRVDKMIDKGLLEEVRTLDTFAQSQALAGDSVDETRGIWPSIGFKEFKPYLRALHSPEMTESDLIDCYKTALGKTKKNTRHYAKSQLKYIRIKLHHALAQANTSKSLYLLDGSDVSRFDDDVVDPAIRLTDDFLTASNPMPEPTSLSAVAAEMLVPKRDYDLAATPEKWARKYCEACGVTSVMEDQWQVHLKSKGHKKKMRENKKAQNGDVRRSLDDVKTAGTASAENKPTRDLSPEYNVDMDWYNCLKLEEP